MLAGARSNLAPLGAVSILVLPADRDDGSWIGISCAFLRCLQANRYYRWFADKLLFPKISEWHPLLTTLVFADQQTVVRADILTTTDNLYRGMISAHFIDSVDKLTGLILTDAKRFARPTYLRDEKENRQWKAEEYWKEIPGASVPVRR